MASTVKIAGLREFGERMKALGSDVAKKVARSATNAAAQTIKKPAIAKAPSDTGNLKKNIIVRRIPNSETKLTSEHIVTVRQGKLTEKQKSKGLQDAFYARFVEFGTVKMGPRPFLRPAFDENKTKAVDAMVKRIKQRIDKGR